VRILFVGMSESIHVARWTRQVIDQGWDLHLFPAREGFVRSEFRNMTVYRRSIGRPADVHMSVTTRGILPFGRGQGLLVRMLESIYPALVDRAAWLAMVVRILKPDILHSMEFQHAGYLVLEAKARLGKSFPTWIATNWGSDIFLFGRLAGHSEKVKAILSQCDYYSCECERDVALARELGLNAKTLPVLPNTGGFDLELIKQFRWPGPTSKRKTILVKGYQGWAYRSLVALRAIELCAESLRGYTVKVYLGDNEAVQMKAAQVSRSTGIPIQLVPYCSHEDMLRLHGSARVHLAVNISDAVSTAFLEALVMGAFPIQSCTACADEWIEHGKTGFIVPPEDPEVVAEALRRAVSDDTLVDRAAEMNARVAAERLDYRKIKCDVVEIYRQICAQNGRRERRNIRFGTHPV
jgi:glycosyltransferase involved in cell wall biosynthesis